VHHALDTTFKSSTAVPTQPTETRTSPSVGMKATRELDAVCMPIPSTTTSSPMVPSDASAQSALFRRARDMSELRSHVEVARLRRIGYCQRGKSQQPWL